MSDEELIARLRSDHPDHLTSAAADRIEALIAERDHWSGVARREGVCMTCRGPRGAPEPYGCSDCLNTGYCGERHNTVADLGAKLAKSADMMLSLIAMIQHAIGPGKDVFIEPDTGRKLSDAIATLAELKGDSHE